MEEKHQCSITYSIMDGSFVLKMWSVRIHGIDISIGNWNENSVHNKRWEGRMSSHNSYICLKSSGVSNRKITVFMCKPQYFMLFLSRPHKHKKRTNQSNVSHNLVIHHSACSANMSGFYFRTVCALGLSVCFLMTAHQPQRLYGSEWDDHIIMFIDLKKYRDCL